MFRRKRERAQATSTILLLLIAAACGFLASLGVGLAFYHSIEWVNAIVFAAVLTVGYCVVMYIQERHREPTRRNRR